MQVLLNRMAEYPLATFGGKNMSTKNGTFLEGTEATTLGKAQALMDIIRRGNSLSGAQINGKSYVALNQSEAQLAINVLNAIRDYNGLDHVALTTNSGMIQDAQYGALAMSYQNAIDHGLNGFSWQPEGGVRATNSAVLSMWRGIATGNHLRACS